MKGHMAIYITTHGFFGGFALKPKKIKQFGPDGSPIYSTPIRFTLTSIGIEKTSKRRQGIFNTDTLPPNTIEACKEWFGEEDWKNKLEKALDEFGKQNGLARIKDGEVPPVNHPHKDIVITGMRTVGGVRGRTNHPADADEK